MYPGIHNFSEIGKLNKVLLHRPGKELEALTPATLERLLFDDVPYLKIAQQEHDNFARVLRENGVEVVYYVDEVAKAIADPARQIQLVNDFLNISKIHAKGLRASMTSYLLNMPPKEMVTELIAGIKRSEVATKEATSLMDLVDDDYPFVSDPMPNLYFTRDPGACVGEGINIHRMHTPARKRESLLLKYMFLYNRDFATQDNKMWYDLSDSYSIEGGDVLVLSKDIVAVGLSERTTVSGAETFARNLLQNSDFKKVLAFDIQPEAVESTRALIGERGCSGFARVVLDSHANMARYAAPGSVDCIVFNFGWLPGADHGVFSHAQSSIPALEAALEALRPGGVLSAILYSGKVIGSDEKTEILQWMRSRPLKQCTALVCGFANWADTAPLPCFLLKK